MKSSSDVLTSSDGSNQTMPSTPNEDQNNWNNSHIPTSAVCLNDIFTYVQKDCNEISQISLNNSINEDQLANLIISRNNSASTSELSLANNLALSSSQMNESVLMDAMTTGTELKLLADDLQNNESFNLLDNYVVRVSSEFAEDSVPKSRYVFLNNPQMIANNQINNNIDTISFNNENNIQIFHNNTNNQSIEGFSFSSDFDLFRAADNDFNSIPSINLTDPPITTDTEATLLISNNNDLINNTSNNNIDSINNTSNNNTINIMEGINKDPSNNSLSNEMNNTASLSFDVSQVAIKHFFDLFNQFLDNFILRIIEKKLILIKMSIFSRNVDIIKL